MPCRARSMNVKTGACKPTKIDSRVLDDSNVKYSWKESIQETSMETQLDAGMNNDVTGGPPDTASVSTAAVAG